MQGGETRWCGPAMGMTSDHKCRCHAREPPAGKTRQKKAREYNGTPRTQTGKNGEGRLAWLLYPEHPRVCGEELTSRPALIYGRGTPRSRGEDIKMLKLLETGLGNTPACAGKTAAEFCAARFVTEHPCVRREDFQPLALCLGFFGTPRVCGEDSTMSSITSRWSGTPPRAQGRPSRKAREDVGRNTPARAGTHRRRKGALAAIEHPRVREKPPISQPYACRWNTPACTGKTMVDSPVSSGQPEHPRMHGENQNAPAFLYAEHGTPPHARGKL